MNTETSVIAHLRGVAKSYGDVRAVNDIELQLRRGEITVLLGPNGAGKSTLLGLLLGLMRPTAGSVEVLGGDPTRRAVRAHVGALLQQTNAPSHLRVGELLQLWSSYYDRPLAMETVAQQAGISDWLDRRFDQLSGGQQRRTQYALALVGDPQLLILDEPSTAMDVNARRAFWDQLRQLAKTRTVVLATHDLLEAEALADRMLVMDRGRLIADEDAIGLGRQAQQARIEVELPSGFQLPPGLADGVTVDGSHHVWTTAQPEDLLRALLASCGDARLQRFERGGIRSMAETLLQQPVLEGSA